MKKTTSFTLLLLCLFGFSQTKSELDSLHDLSKPYINSNKEQYNTLSRFFITKAEENQLFETMGAALVIKGPSNLYIGNFDSARNFLNEAIEAFDKCNSAKGKFKSNHQLTGAFMRQSRLDTDLFGI